jgi:hypothetical protein
MTNLILTAPLLLVASAVVDSAARACGNEPPMGASVIAISNYLHNFDNGENVVYVLQANQSSLGAIV